MLCQKPCSFISIAKSSGLNKCWKYAESPKIVWKRNNTNKVNPEIANKRTAATTTNVLLVSGEERHLVFIATLR